MTDGISCPPTGGGAVIGVNVTFGYAGELRERVTGLYGVAPVIEFVEIAEIVDNSRP